MTPFGWLWVAWIVAFFLIEFWAIFTKAKGGTLSEHLREWLGVYPIRGWRIAGWALVLGFCIWFPVHILIDLPGIL